MSSIPRDPALDSTLALFREGYEFIWNRCKRFQSELFQARFMGKPALCIHGRDAAQLFYDDSKLQRGGAVPRRIVTSLFGKHGIQTLDGSAHRHRKAAFLALMNATNLQRLMDETAQHWRRSIMEWEQSETVVLFDETQRLLTRAACAWAGVPLDAREVSRRARDFCQMVDAFGGAGPRLWKGKLARARAERWMEGVVQEARSSGLRAEPGTALQVMAALRAESGELLPARVAAVELLNVIRPTVAISWYISFAALALHQHPDSRLELAAETPGEAAEGYAHLFVQEVRRFYPFAPFLGARVRAPFAWRGHHFEPGTLVLLDVYGTHHDPQIWAAPEEFRPERFAGWNGDSFGFIAQGGGDPARGHRCAGEWITMHQLTLALHFLTRCVQYDVPPQDLRFDLARMPTRPRSGFVMSGLRSTPALLGPTPRLPSAFAARQTAAE
jgi:fatty-acid peroxygenase